MEEKAVDGRKAAGEPEAEAGETPVGGFVEALAVRDAWEDDGAAAMGEIDVCGAIESQVLDWVSVGENGGGRRIGVRLRSRRPYYPGL